MDIPLPETTTILIAEDDDGQALLIQEHLKDAGLRNPVLRFRDGQDVLDFLFRTGESRLQRQEGSAYVLLLDINMPRVDGLTVLQRIKTDAALQKIPVVMLTTTDDPLEVEECYRRGCNAYLTKPVSLVGFSESIARLGAFLQVLRVAKVGASGGSLPGTNAPEGFLTLLVEDDPGIAELMRTILDDMGLRSAMARTGAEALTLIQELRPGLVLLDYSLPDMTGLELLTKAEPMPPFMVTTGAGDERIAVRLMQCGARDYLVKDAQFLDALPKALSRVMRELATERKLRDTEQELKLRSERLQLALEGTDDAFWDWDLTTGALYYSDHWFDMFGYRRGEMEVTVSHWEAHLHPEDKERVLAALREHFEGRTPFYQSEHRLRTKNGDYLWIQGRGKVVSRDERGRPLRAAGMISDISARKQAEAELRKLTTAVEQSPASIVITDLHGNIEYVNPAFCEHTGYSVQEALGNNPRILKSGAQSSELYQEMWHTISSGGTWRGEFHNRKKNGELFWEMVVIGPILNEEGRITHYLAVKEDITERKRSEEALRRAQKLESLGVMAGGIAHDFNNLFTAVLGNVDIVEMSLSADSPAKAQLDIIRHAVSRATTLSRQMLAFSGMGRFVPEHLDLNLLIAEMGSELRSRLPAGAVLQIHTDPGSPTLEGDAHQIQQLIEALLTNAGEALGEGGGEIQVLTRNLELDSLPEGAQFPGLAFVPGEYSILEVRDSGCGMPAELLPKIFDPFFSTKFTGRGLSLAATMGILRTHNAGIRVESRPGEGSVFTVYFPGLSASARRTPRSAVPAPEFRPGPKRVLLVDDEDVLRESTGELLRSLGYEVIEAVDGQDALDKFQAHASEIGLVIMDLTMPRMDGKEAFLAMKRLDPEARIVLSSGYSEHEVTGSIHDKSLAGFLQKPYRFKELQALVERLLG